MKQTLRWTGILAAAALTAGPAGAQSAGQGAASPRDQAALEAAARKVEEWGKDPVVVKMVLAQNAAKASLAEIQALDKLWIAGNAEDKVRGLLANDCSVRLRQLIESQAAYSEAFVMDDQGGTVCMTNKTSDYWQGDEAKWQRAWSGGKGAVFIDQPRYDTSAKAILVQVSVPVVDGPRVIGALTVGVRTGPRDATTPAR